MEANKVLQSTKKITFTIYEYDDLSRRVEMERENIGIIEIVGILELEKYRLILSMNKDNIELI